MTITPRRHRSAGFTLIELLVALTLAGLVSVMLMHGIGLAALGFDRLSRGAERLDQSRGLDQVLRRSLASAAAVPGYGAGIGFSGATTRVGFLSLVNDNGPGLYQVEIGLDLSGGERRLVLTRRFAAPGIAPHFERSVLAQGVRTFQITYFGAIGLGETPAWQDHWDGLGYLPSLVRVELTTTDAPARPPLIVRVWDAG
jgi:general secretion pathway protein J